jgi:hypothetical protein
LKKYFVAIFILIVQICLAQKLDIKPYVSFSYSLNSAGKPRFNDVLSLKAKLEPRRLQPLVGIDFNYIFKNRVGIRVGLMYVKNKSLVKGFEINKLTPIWETTDYNLWAPFAMTYQLPLNSAERFINFSVGTFLGYNRVMLTGYRQYLENPYWVVPNVDFIQRTGYEPVKNLKRPQIGLILGFEIQPFRKLNGFMLGFDYSASFSRTMASIFSVGDPITNYSSQLYSSPIRQSYLNFKLLYNFSVGKHPKYEKWKFLNIVKEVDSSYLHEPKRIIREVPKLSIVPYIQAQVGWSHALLRNKDELKQQRMTLKPNGISYGVQLGANLMWSKNMGVGLGYNFGASKYDLIGDTTFVPDFRNSNHRWSATSFQHQLHLHFIYRLYWANNYKHLEFSPGLYVGANEYYVVQYRETITINNPQVAFPSHEENVNFAPQFLAGFSGGFQVHPFAQNIGLKFGVNYQLDFTRAAGIGYVSQFSNLSGSIQDNRAITIRPQYSKLMFTVTYAPTINLKAKPKD